MKSLRFAALVFVTCLAGLGLSDTALAQGVILTVTPQQLSFDDVPSGGTSQAKSVNVTSNIPTTVAVIQITSWLSVTPSSANVGANATAFSVRVNAQSLAEGTYQGSFTVALSQSPTPNQVTVNVQATVTGTSLLSANPSSLTFTAQAGSNTASPASTTVQILSNGPTLNYTLSATAPWLGLSSAGGTTGGAGFAVSANPAGLTPGTYTGTILVQSSSTNDTVQIAVMLTVNANATLSVTPAMPTPFLYQFGGALPQPKLLQVTSSGGQVAFNVSQNPQTNWLVIEPLSGSAGVAPATITLSVNPQGLGAGVYTTGLVVTPVNGSPLTPVTITLVISTNPLLQISASTLSFTAPFGGAAPADQTVEVTAVGSGGPLGFNFASNASWLSATSATGKTPGSLNVHANPDGLAIGEHSGIITVSPTNGDFYSLQIRVTFTITDISELTAGPAVLLFSYQTGMSAPQPQNVRLDSVGQPTTFTVSTTTANCGNNWITTGISGSTTPATLTVAVDVSGMQPGVCSGTVRVNFNAGSGTSTLILPVSVNVSATPLLRVSLPQGFGVLTVQQGSVAQQLTVTLTSTDPQVPVNYTTSASSGGGQWLQAPGVGTTPQNVNFAVVPGSLAPGTYMGEIRIQSDSLPSGMFTIPVRLRVLPNITVTATPNVLSFDQPQDGPLPEAKNVTLSSSAEGATFTASIISISGGDWLALDRTSGTASGAIAFSIKSNTLVQNSYQATVRLVFQNSSSQPVNITVILNITPPRNLSTSVSALLFAYQVGGTLPPTQTVNVTATGAPAQFTVGTVSSGWLSVSPTSGATPTTLTVSVNPQGLTSASYSGSITITAPGIAGSPKTIGVTLVVTGPPPPELTVITNNASNVAGVIAPGELITIKGTFLGPTAAASFSVGSANTVSSTLAGVRVLFDGIAGTPIYASDKQINVTVPYEIRGRLQTTIVVEYQGTRSAGITVRLSETAPGIYTLDSTGQGQAAAVNQNGTFNGPSGGSTTPAAAGSVIVLYATGGGQTNPASFTGAVSPTTSLLRIPGTITATVGGKPATVDFTGAAPGLVTGVVQINLRPDASVHGVVGVEISINGVTSPAGPTVAIQ